MSDMSDINISLTNSKIKYKPMSNYIKISPNEVKIKTGNKKLEKVFYIVCGILTIVLIYYLFNFFSYSFSKKFFVFLILILYLFLLFIGTFKYSSSISICFDKNNNILLITEKKLLRKMIVYNNMIDIEKLFVKYKYNKFYELYYVNKNNQEEEKIYEFFSYNFKDDQCETINYSLEKII